MAVASREYSPATRNPSPPPPITPYTGTTSMCNSFNNPRLKLACSSHGGSPIPYLSEENFLLARKKFSMPSLLFSSETDGRPYSGAWAKQIPPHLATA